MLRLTQQGGLFTLSANLVHTMETATLETSQPVFVPKSYLSETQRAEILREHHDDWEEVYFSESDAAAAAGDEDSAWGWMAKVRLPHYSLMRLKRNHGAGFIRKFGFPTAEADLAYGQGWLDREVPI